MESPFWVIGHRGSPVSHVENTLPSLAAALDAGANAVEVDVSVTRDRRGVLWHDWDPNALKSLMRAMCLEPLLRHKPVAPWGRYRAKVSELTLSDFLQHYGYAEKRWRAPRLEIPVPTLREFFEWGARDGRLACVFLDLKMPPSEIGLLPVVLTELDALVSALSPSFRIVLETAEVEVLAELRALGSRYPACFDVEPRPGLVRDLVRCSAVRRAIEHGARIASPQRPRPITWMPFATHRRIVARELALLRMHNAASPPVPLEGVVSFTINDEDEMSTLIRLGVRGIQTDRPRLLRRVVDRLATLDWRAEPSMARSPLVAHDGGGAVRCPR